MSSIGITSARLAPGDTDAFKPLVAPQRTYEACDALASLECTYRGSNGHLRIEEVSHGTELTLGTDASLTENLATLRQWFSEIEASLRERGFV